MSKKFKKEQLLRKHRQTFLFNKKEREAVEAYMAKYKISNKSKFMREAILALTLQQLTDDYPTLFTKKELDRLIV